MNKAHVCIVMKMHRYIGSAHTRKCTSSPLRDSPLRDIGTGKQAHECHDDIVIIRSIFNMVCTWPLPSANWTKTFVAYSQEYAAVHRQHVHSRTCNNHHYSGTPVPGSFSLAGSRALLEAHPDHSLGALPSEVPLSFNYLIPQNGPNARSFSPSTGEVTSAWLFVPNRSYDL